jgi:hypothetical protein
MDSRVVGRKIQEEIWPLLRNHGFADFTMRTAWRRLPEQIHVVNFQSFNSYLAAGVGCTTFSFALNLGIYFRSIPADYPFSGGPDPTVRPQEYHCHFRHRLLKGIDQPDLRRRETWYVAANGKNVQLAVSDARDVLEREGLHCFDEFASLEEVLHLLLNEELPEIHAAPHSPARKYIIGHIARRLGRVEVSEPMIAEANRELGAIRSQFSKAGRTQRG